MLPSRWHISLHISARQCLTLNFDTSTLCKYNIYSLTDEMMHSGFLALSYSVPRTHVCSYSTLAWRIKGPCLLRDGAAVKTAALWLSSFVPRTKERQKGGGENGVRPASIRWVQVKIPIWDTDADEWRWRGGRGGGEERTGRREGEQQGKSLSLPNLTHTLMHSRGNS